MVIIKLKWSKVDDGWVGQAGDDFTAVVSRSGRHLGRWTYTISRQFPRGGGSLSGGGWFSTDKDAKKAVEALYYRDR